MEAVEQKDAGPDATLGRGRRSRQQAAAIGRACRSRVIGSIPGLALAGTVAVAATIVGHFLPLVGGPVTGILLGVVIACVFKPGERLRPGIIVAGKSVLQLSVVVLGSQLSLDQIARVGIESLPVMLGTLAVCLGSALVIGRWLGVVGDLRSLIGVGTGICGASAIAAVTPVIGAASVEVAYAVSTIFVFNVAAVLTFPLVGQLLNLSPHAFGLFAGTAVNDMSSVVAAAATYGSGATNYAVVVKLVRTLMIIPICLALAAWLGRKSKKRHAANGRLTEKEQPAGEHPQVPVLRLIPWFLFGFLVLAGVNTAGLFSAGVHSFLSSASVFLITLALSAIGLSTKVTELRRAGVRPLILGGALWVIVALTSLSLQWLSGLT